jgi:hypothetical protein
MMELYSVFGIPLSGIPTAIGTIVAVFVIFLLIGAIARHFVAAAILILALVVVLTILGISQPSVYSDLKSAYNLASLYGPELWTAIISLALGSVVSAALGFIIGFFFLGKR